MESEGEEAHSEKEIRLLMEEIKKQGYDLKEDYILLKPYEIELNSMDFDITIAEYLIDSKSSTSYECSAIAMKYLTRKIKSKEDNSQSESCSKEMVCAPVKEASAS